MIDPLQNYTRVDYYRSDPDNPTDLLSQPIVEGDYVAWPVSIGRSVGMNVGVIEEINFRHKNPAYPHKHRAPEWVKGPQAGADHYTLRLRPIAGTGNYSLPTEYVPDGFVDEHGDRRHFRPTGEGIKPITLHQVSKVLKIDPKVLHDFLESVER